ncbi:MAG: hypothetical protein ACLTKM_05805 [Bifidobacterium longum]
MTHEYPRFTITNSHHHPTKPQPVTVTVPEKVEADLILGTTDLGQSSPFQKVLGDSDGSSTTFIGILVPHDGEVLSLHDPDPGRRLKEASSLTTTRSKAMRSATLIRDISTLNYVVAPARARAPPNGASAISAPRTRDSTCSRAGTTPLAGSTALSSLRKTV